MLGYTVAAKLTVAPPSIVDPELLPLEEEEEEEEEEEDDGEEPDEDDPPPPMAFAACVSTQSVTH